MKKRKKEEKGEKKKKRKKVRKKEEKILMLLNPIDTEFGDHFRNSYSKNIFDSLRIFQNAVVVLVGRGFGVFGERTAGAG